MSKLLTIIIPAYNVAEYIEQGIDSLVECKSILNNLDIIIINDGSKDDTFDKIKKYENQYPQCIRIISKKNGGHGSVLNLGIREAKGVYLRILDGDDWVINEGLVKLVKFIDDNKLNAEKIDMIISPSENIYVNKNYNKKLKRRLNISDGSSISLGKLCELNYYFEFANFTVRSDIFKINVKWQMDEGIFYDDVEYNIFPLAYVKNIIYLDDVIYQYRVGRVGQSMSIASKRKNYWMLEKALDTCIAYYREVREQLDDGQRAMMVHMLIWQISAICNWHLIRKDIRMAKRDMKALLEKYGDLPIGKMDNVKMQILFRTKFYGYSIISLLYRFKLYIL